MPPGSAGTSARSSRSRRTSAGAARTRATARTTDLASRLGAACIKGLQGSSLSADGTAAATAKHFIGDGGTAFGSSPATGPTGPYLLDQGVDQM